METYNTPFSIDELLDALSSSNDSAVGPDDIHYQMLKHLPSEALHTLLSILKDDMQRFFTILIQKSFLAAYCNINLSV